MTSEEMQVLKALEMALECAEESYEFGETYTLTRIALAHVEQLKAAIEVVKRWETKE